MFIPKPHSNGMKAAQNLDFVSKFLLIVFGTLTRQKSNYPLSAEYMALDALGNSCYQVAPFHPVELKILMLLITSKY